MSIPLILLVEDEPSICVAVKRLLERHNFDVRVANTFGGALTEVRAEQFDEWVRPEAMVGRPT